MLNKMFKKPISVVIQCVFQYNLWCLGNHEWCIDKYCERLEQVSECFITKQRTTGDISQRSHVKTHQPQADSGRPEGEDMEAWQ